MSLVGHEHVTQTRCGKEQSFCFLLKTQATLLNQAFGRSETLQIQHPLMRTDSMGCSFKSSAENLFQIPQKVITSFKIKVYGCT